MSLLGTAIRNNAELHEVVYLVIGALAAAHMTKQDIGRGQFDYLCSLAAAALPHLPPPPITTVDNISEAKP